MTGFIKRKRKVNLKKIEINKDGEVETKWILTSDQYYFLVNYAVNDLIRKGVATVELLTEEELKKIQTEVSEESRKEFLVNLPPDNMYKA